MFGMILGLLVSLYSIAMLFHVVAAVIWAVFSGCASLVSTGMTGKGILIGIVLGWAAYRAWHRRSAKAEENE